MTAPLESEHEEFAKLAAFRIKHVEVSEYSSLLTGARVFFMRYETPLVNTYVLLPTREETDEGLPHTLEHLIFLGSEKYPFRGTLDLISFKSLASGTNAWTSTDHTAYTLSTAGLEGTLQMLPIFLDHILRPCLTEVAFMTDIHHVGADGSSGGVAYCEMKSRENLPEEMMFFEAVDKLYPGDSGYKRNTGGRMAGLRATNIHRVRDFHTKFYNWSNLSIVLCGNVTDVKSVLDLVHEQQLAISPPSRPRKRGRPPKDQKPERLDLSEVSRLRPRVWNDPKHVQKLEKSTHSTLYFPCEEEESGSFSMSWRGPGWDEFLLLRSVSLVGSYLVDSTASPLEKALIHTTDPFGSCVDFSIEAFKESYFQIVIKDIPMDGASPGHSSEGEEESPHQPGADVTSEETEVLPNKMDRVEERLKSVLLDVYNAPLDMERMRMLIRRGHHNYLRQIETCAHETLIENVIGYIIYGDNPEQLKNLVVDYDVVETLLQKDEGYWKQVLHRYFIEPPAVSVKCVPSVDRSKQIQREEKELMEAQMAKYGKDKLLKNKETVDAEMERNKDGPPKHILNRFKQCDSKLIYLPTYPLYRNFKYGHSELAGSEAHLHTDSAEQAQEDKARRRAELDRFMPDLERVRYPLQVNNIPTDFVRIYVLFSTCKMALSNEEKRLLFLLCVLLFESNVHMGDKLVPSDEFIKTLMENTTSYGCNLGLSSSAALPDAYADLLSVYFTCPVDRYKKLLDLFYNVIYNVKYDRDILNKHVKSLVNAFSKKKRSAKTLLKQLNNYLKVNERSVRHLCSMGQQDALFKRMLAEPGAPAATAEKLQNLHAKVFDVRNMSVHITADLSKMDQDWLKFWVDISSRFSPKVEPPLESNRHQEQPQKLEVHGFKVGKGDSGLEVKGNKEASDAHKDGGLLKMEFQEAAKRVLNEYYGLEYGRDREVKKSSGVMSPLASTDVSYLCLAVPAPYGYNNADYFPILTSCEYLTMTEGPLFRAIRGGGYAYHHRVSYSPSQGEIQLVITEATDLVQALRVTREAILKCVDPASDIDQEMLAAKSSLIYRILSNEESLADYSQETFTSALRQTDVDFNKYSVIQELPLARIREVFSRYLASLVEFEGPPKTLSCIASKTDAEAIAEGFETLKYRGVESLDPKALLALLASSADARDR